MIPRYSRPEMAAIWSPETKFRIWFEIEAHACDALAEIGVIPKEAAKTIWEKGGRAVFDIARIDDLVLEIFPDNSIVTNWIRLARENIPFEGLPARIAWLGHGERTELALAVNRLVAAGELKGPVAFSRDHLDAGAMAHPNIMTERMKDGSDAIADWPLLDAMMLCSSMADLVVVHSGGGGYAGYMTSCGVTIVADGTAEADERLDHALTNDTALGVMRYADAGYGEALDEVEKKDVPYIRLG